MARQPVLPRRPGTDGLWFPIGLVILLFLALPAFALLVIQLVATLFGRPSGVNDWLQRAFNLTYHVALPWWALLLLLLLPVLIALLYFLKLRRKPLQVPSTFLWKKSIEDLHVNSLFQWLRNNVLLLLQLLFLLILVYAVMAFQMHGTAGSGKYYILLIDNSASMGVRDGDGGGTRLEAAKAAALREIDARGDDDVGMVIEFNARAGIRQPYTADKVLLRRAVAGVEQTNRRTNIEEALTLADSLANPRQTADDMAVRPDNPAPGKERTYVAADGIKADVHLYSDGRFADVDFAAGNLELNYHRMGRPGPDVDNVGLVTLDATRDEAEPGKLQVFVRALNYRPGPADVKVRLEVRGAGGDLRIYEQPEGGPLRLPARAVRDADPEKKEPAADLPGEGVVTFPLGDVADAEGVTLRASLAGHKDAFPLDDEAWLVLGVVRKARVCVVTPGNAVLKKFFDLEATAKVAQVTYLTPADLRDEGKYLRPARDGGFDLVVFDRCAPESEEALPLGNTFFIADVPPPWKRADLPPLEDTLIRNPGSKHPVMRHLTNLDEIAFTEAFKFDFADERVKGLRVPKLLETGKENAVLFALPRRSFTDLVMAFPLVNDKGEWTTRWMLYLSFPVFLRNVLYTLGNVSDAAAEEGVQPGEVKTIRPDTLVPEVQVTPPGGAAAERVARSSQGDFVFKNTDRVGVYRAAWDGGGRDFAVNLLDAGEGNLQPRDEIQVGSITVAAGRTRGAVWDTWKWAVLAGVVVLLVEWAFYHRRIFT